MKIQVSDVVITDRHRKKFENIDTLAQSIQDVGLIHPIVVEKETKRLIAGERRLRAYQLMGWPEIECTFKEDLSEWEMQSIELEENLRRENLSYAEEVEAKLRLHELYQEKFGETVGVGTRGGRREKGGHTLADTAELLGEAEGLTKMDIQLARAIRNNPELALKDTKSAAYKAMKNTAELSLRSQIADILAEDSKNEGDVDIKIILGNSLDVLKTYPDDFFDFCITDPPYLVDIDNSHDLSKTWDVRVDDDKENYPIIEGIFHELFRVLRPGAHCYIFFATVRWDETKAMLVRSGLWHSPIPLIWTKGKVPPLDPYHQFGSMYEPIFFGSKGSPRSFTKTLLPDNVMSYPVGSKTHPNQKPLDLICRLVENCSVENELGIDPFGGSGTFGVACKKLKRRAVLIEKDKEYYAGAWEKINNYTPTTTIDWNAPRPMGEGVVGEVVSITIVELNKESECECCNRPLKVGDTKVIGWMDDMEYGATRGFCVDCGLIKLRPKVVDKEEET